MVSKPNDRLFNIVFSPNLILQRGSNNCLLGEKLKFSRGGEGNAYFYGNIINVALMSFHGIQTPCPPSPLDLPTPMPNSSSLSTPCLCETGLPIRDLQMPMLIRTFTCRIYTMFE